MTRSFQAPERIGARELELAEQAAATPEPKGTTDHDGDGKMGGVKRLSTPNPAAESKFNTPAEMKALNDARTKAAKPRGKS